ncbi:putative ent-kaurene synthase [Helianthus annuus]|nr:putative ent-kaurene synthase [Helianthus annuus]
MISDPLSTKSYRSWALSAVHTAPSHTRQANPTNRAIDTTASSYDTAWVAMVPSPSSPKSPCFPECLNWLVKNQLDDRSWGLANHNGTHSLLKDSLSSTLACIALKRWNVGEDQINKGICRSNEMEAYLAYNSEGLGNLYDWHMVKNYEMKNGYVFNSPSATAASFINHQDVGCLNYLNSLWTSLVIQRDEQIFMDVVTCGLDFRLLRISGYEVSSEITNEGAFKDEYAALEVYNVSQVLYPEELSFGEQILKLGDFPKRIISTDSNRLSKFICKELKFARQKTTYCYFSVPATLSSPELSDTTISWAKNGILTTVIDDLFDVDGTIEELANQIQCVEKWNVYVDKDCCSEQVRIWLDAMNSALREAMWTRDAYVPTTNEYMENAYVSFASGTDCTPLWVNGALPLGESPLLRTVNQHAPRQLPS